MAGGGQDRDWEIRERWRIGCFLRRLFACRYATTPTLYPPALRFRFGRSSLQSTNRCRLVGYAERSSPPQGEWTVLQVEMKSSSCRVPDTFPIGLPQRMEPSMKLEAVITCPECGHEFPETMPVDSCVHFYECKNCGALLKPLEGDCCVFCSYADLPCPPLQEAGRR